MLYRIMVILGLFVGTTIMTGCKSSSNEAAVTGTVTYLQRIALPPGAVVTVQIQDVSKADAPAEVIGEQVIKTEGKQVPIPFAVSYDPAKIQENHRYSLQARIEDGAGKLLFINDTSIPVITSGNPTQDIEVIVVPVGG
jgi:putative lipoprotein